MSYFLDPPALFLLGIMVYYLSKRFRWSLLITTALMVFISFGLFMGGSTLLYLDLIFWPLPPTQGSVWMFHTNYTGITKAQVPLWFAVFMLLIYPLWHLLGYVVALRLDIGSFLLQMVSYKDVKSRREIPSANVFVRRGDSPRELTRSVIDALGGIGNFVKAEDKVMIKANISGGNPTIPGSFVSSEVVDELVKLIRKVKAKPFVVDSDMIWTRFDPVAEAQGWKKWAQETNVPLINLVETKLVRFNFGAGSSIGQVPVSKELVEADVIISVAAMKTHLLTTVTLGMKNMYGTFPEENKAKFHRFNIEDVIFEVNKAFTPNLTIVDGSIGGEAFGPLSCSPINFQTIVASNDVVAADAVTCQLMGYGPKDIVHIKKAHEEALGDADIPFDFKSLPYTHKKDGKWEKPEPSVSKFYERLIEAFLMLPGMQVFFDLAADFLLFDLARLPILKELTREIERFFDNILGPILKELTPETERVLSDILAALMGSGYRGYKWTEDELKKAQERFGR